jgi:uncharacterized membrane protein YphA (DoxX/SURF4 family)
MTPPKDKRLLSNLGLYVYGFAGIALGVSGLVWNDFATNWQRVPKDLPHREALAYITAVYEVLAGIAIFWRRTAQAGALMLTVLYSIFALLWVPQIITAPGVYDMWGNFFEEFSLVIGGVVLYLSLAEGDSAWALKRPLISRLYGVCVISFALEQVFFISGTASFVPKWIPPGQLFWAIATTVFFALGAAAILSGILAGLASRLLTAMIVGFGILVWAPRLFSAPHEHFSWAGNTINLAMAGAAWIVADAINDSRAASPKLQQPGA